MFNRTAVKAHKKIYLHRPNLAVKAEFSSENPPAFRYRMEITKHDAIDSLRTVCAIMQNPSIADEKVADKSIQVLERVIFEKNLQEFMGVDRLIVVNQFAYIQTNDFIGTDEQIGTENDSTIEAAVNESEIVLVAWGKSNSFKQRQTRILDIIQAMDNKILLQTSRHPSRVVYNGFIEPLY